MGAEAAAGASVCRSGAAETILLLSATMWLHIRTDEGVSAASAPPSAPLPSYCAQRRAAWLRGGAAAGAHASTREEMRRLRLQQQLIPIRSDAAKTPSGTAEFLTAAFSRRASAHSAIRLHQREIGARVKRFYFIFFYTRPWVSRRGARRAERQGMKGAPSGLAWSILRVSGCADLVCRFRPAGWRAWVTWVLRSVRERLRRLADI